MRVYGSGPLNAKVMIVGEAPGEQETFSGKPFVGTSGKLLTDMLHEAGIVRRDCYLTNVMSFEPFGGDMDNMFCSSKKEAEENFVPLWHGKYPIHELLDCVFDVYSQIDQVQPNLIIACGNTALWALTGKDKITDWRGSVMSSLPINGKIYKVIPTYNPAVVQRMWEWKPIMIHDLCRASKETETPGYTFPPWNFIVRPSYETVMNTFEFLRERLSEGPTPLSIDIETRHRAISCIGIAWNKLDAISIPIQCVERREGYWTLDEEVEILWQFMQIVQHPNCQVIGQNYHYDTQFFARELGLKSIPYFDTMVAQHTIWPGLPKALHFIASLYCDFYQFWKDEGREWDESMPEEQHWRYNCLDCVYTFEAYQRLDKLLDEMSQREQYKFQMRLFWPVLKMMLRGVRQSLPLRSKYLMECLEHMAQLEQKLADDLGHPLNPRSVPQLRTLFYTDFALRPVLHKKTKKPTCDDDALEVLATREPLIRSICDDINAFRSLGQFVGALKARLDPDMRMRASFGICGTETTRFNSGINPWGTGTNFQNVSTGERRPELNLPNVRRCFLADPGKILLEPDLAGADAQVVAWEANDEKLKAAFRAGLKIHAVNAKDIFGAQAGPDGRREPYYTRTKVGVHLTNYGGRARTCATALGLTVHEAERFQKRWFSIHPEILEWHRRIENELRTRRYVENKFGYRRYYFGRPESSLTEALAWVPQSTVAGTINRGLVNIDENLKWAQILIQVHDSLLIQIPKYLFPDQLPLIKKLLLVTIPYDDPLTIRTELKVSDVSWGDEKKYEEWDKMAA